MPINHAIDIAGPGFKWIDFFHTHSKKDDLADCFLQGIWYIKNR
jgi:hypothetical protein